MPKSEIIKFLIVRTIGNFLFLFGVAGIVLTFGQALYQEGIYRYNSLRGVHYTVAQSQTDNPTATSGFGEMLGGAYVVPIVPVNSDFSVVIPKINANAQIVPNVDAANYDEYMVALQKGVAHAAGTVFPGMTGNVFLFAHSTDYFWNVGRYNAIFYLLKELESGDEIDIFFQGRRYVYIVDDKKITNPDQVDVIKDSFSGEPRLTLETCWPPGTTIKRLLIFAKPKIST